MKNDSAATTISHGKKWRQVSAPKVWRPKDGDTLVGAYGGISIKKGMHGEYRNLIVRTDNETFLVSGTKIMSLVDASGVETLQNVRVVYKGLVDVGNEHPMKDYDLFIEK